MTLNRYLTLIFLLFALVYPAHSWGAKDSLDSLISPGELAASHAKYEGISNCIKCHKIRGGVPDSLCLDCHDKLQKRIDEKKGMHARHKDPCIKCHMDHKGASYKMISFDKGRFDHSLADYPLKDKHIKVACKDCHKKADTYSLEPHGCVDCHKDEHKGQLDRACDKCHVEAGWKEVKKFNHDLANYKLDGKHKDVQCVKCHLKGKYKPLSFKTCSTGDCHPDEHKKQFPDKPCDACHTVKTWKPSTFDHAAPAYKGYKLDGKHVDVKCEKCHEQGKYRPVKHKNCLDCHKDVHKEQFKGKTCESCHTTRTWKTIAFDHDSPEYKGYKLEGKHRDVKCEKCHPKGKYKPLEHKTCSTGDCHPDEHKKQFPDKTCDACHTVKTWKPSTFEHNAPAYKGYKLDGKHLTTKCDKCHEQGKYKPVFSACISCHEKDDTHKEELGWVCGKCHVTDNWKKLTLDHDKQTRFALRGKHKDTKCEKCHENKRYTTKAEKCIDCHKDEHKGAFKEGCEACHTETDWKPKKFDHKKYARSPLEGAHNEVVCKECHTVKESYKQVKRLCVECHRDPHTGQFGATECLRCHTQDNWNPIKFRHGERGFALKGAHLAADCSSCHRNGRFRPTPTLCYSCHQSDYAGAPNHSANGYSQNCTQCHWATFVSWDFKHQGLSTGCSSCHLSERPASHTSDPTTYPVTCEQCHRYPTWAYVHTTASTGCSSCHLNDRPSTHTADTSKYPTTCESCHRYPTWTYTHTTASTGCSSCHLNDRPSTHTANPSTYTTTCESCHAYPTWTFNHTSVSSSCSSCHSADAPSGHTAYPSAFGTSCGSCHSYPSWTPGTINHSALTSFPTSHRGFSSCSDCHPNQNYGSGNCIDCHRAEGAEVHETNSNSVCLSCHPTGR